MMFKGTLRWNDNLGTTTRQMWAGRTGSDPADLAEGVDIIIVNPDTL